MQTRVQSTLEVLVDFACSILINIGGQLLFYPTVATVGRVTLFAALVLGLALARRLATRRFFEALVPLGTRQPHWQSVMESVVDTSLGYGVAVALQMLIYGEAATFLRASSLTFVIYGLTMVRRYILRRLFAALALRTA
jgi:hypothetical protein